MSRRLFLAWLLCLSLAPAVGAHGTRYEPIEGGRAVKALYDDGRPMTFCDVTVTAPAGEEGAFLSGMTDGNGNFAFVPDTNGAWRVTVDDGMGHLLAVDLRVTSAGAGSGRGRTTPRPTAGPGRLRGVLIGVSLIFGCFGLVSLMRGRGGRGGRRP